MEFSFFYRHAGLVSVHFGDWAVHLFPSPKFWKWGHSIEPYAQCMDYWGFGPLLLVCKM